MVQVNLSFNKRLHYGLCILVFVGGGLGSLWSVMVLLAGPWLVASSFPYATLLANVLSCVLLGIFVGLQVRMPFSEHQRLLFAVGFCGGFSTFSTFTTETLSLLHEGYVFTALANILGNLILCIVSMIVGLHVGKL